MKPSASFTTLMIIVIMIVSTGLSACKKDESSPSKTDLLTKSLWKVTAYTADPVYPVFDENWNITGYTSDLYSLMENCSKDNTFKFNTDKTIKMDEGATKCNPSNITTSGSWSFNTDETILSLATDGSSPIYYDLLELTQNTLKLKYFTSDGNSSYTFITTFSH